MKASTSNGEMESEYDSIDWFNLREEVLERDKWKCKLCGEYASIAHHLTYKYGIICDPKWLMSMCRTCHDELRGNN
jgi:hypothetical protein